MSTPGPRRSDAEKPRRLLTPRRKAPSVRLLFWTRKTDERERVLKEADAAQRAEYRAAVTRLLAPDPGRGREAPRIRAGGPVR